MGGDLLQTENGLRLTVRGDGFLARSFDGVDLGHLAAEAADYVYGRSQPLQYAMYLADNGRDADALAFLPGAFSRAGTDDERAKLANEWGDAFADLNRNAEAAGKYRLAMSLKAHDWPAWSNLLAVVVSLDGEEAGWRESSAFLAQAAETREEERPKPRSLSNPAFLTWDLPLALAGLLDNANGNGGAGSFSTINGQPASRTGRSPPGRLCRGPTRPRNGERQGAALRRSAEGIGRPADGEARTRADGPEI